MQRSSNSLSRVQTPSPQCSGTIYHATKVPSMDPDRAVATAARSGTRSQTSTTTARSQDHSSDPDLIGLMSEAYRMYMLANPLHTDLFNNCRQVEAEVGACATVVFVLQWQKWRQRWGSDTTPPQTA